MLKYFVQTKIFSFIFPSETSCVHLKVHIDSDSVVGQEHIDRAIKFGVDLDNPADPIETKKYVLAFIHHLLLQREKLDLELLTDYLEPGILTLWQEVLSTVEESNRKLLEVQSGKYHLHIVLSDS